jgi:hypothetical protein
MKKRQMKKEQKKLTLLAAQEVLNTCLEADDPLATLKEIRTRGEQYFKQLGLDVPPAVFNELMTQLEPIVKKLGTNQ